MSETAVLLMAYGTPSREEEIEPYLADIRGRKPQRDDVEHLKDRYRAIGGRSPLLEITQAQATALQNALVEKGVPARVYVGMKHWHPYITEVVPSIVKDGFRDVLAIILAPHYSDLSAGGYVKALRTALTQANGRLTVNLIRSWHEHPLFHKAVAQRIEQARQYFNPGEKFQLIFTAHSLPERILENHDPYPGELRSSCEAVASLLEVNDWFLAYQSAGRTKEKWLGPDLKELIEQLSGIGNEFDRNLLITPIGFVSDHLEILYDIDIQARSIADAHGLRLMRTESLNTDPAFISTLVDLVTDAEVWKPAPVGRG